VLKLLQNYRLALILPLKNTLQSQNTDKIITDCSGALSPFFNLCMNIHPGIGTGLSLTKKFVLLLVAVLLVSVTHTVAQCALICKSALQMALDEYGQAPVTADLLTINAATSCPGELKVTLVADDGSILSDSTLTCEVAGQGVTATVKHLSSGNTCNTLIQVRDFLAPSGQCPDRWVDCAQNTHPSVLGTPLFTDNCTPSAWMTPTYSEQMTNLPCGTMQDSVAVTGRIFRHWQITDDAGNTGFCIERIWIRASTLNEVVFPVNLDGIATPALNCGQNYTDLALTGRPTLHGIPVAPGGFCDLALTFSDQVLPGCSPGSFTVLRKWIVVHDCGNLIRQQTQVIKVTDTQPPVMTLPPSPVFATSLSDCRAVITLPTLTTTDNCSSVTVQASWVYGNGFGPFNAIPEGEHVVTYIATDACGNSSTGTMLLYVADQEPPQALCAASLQISLGATGMALVNTAAVNAGSWDNCGFVEMALSRNDSTWATTAAFNCADAGENQTVILRVTDANGQANFCETQVMARDFLKPNLTCPPAITLNCQQDAFDLSLTGNAIASDNCSLPSLTMQHLNALDNCNLGTLLRQWTATDESGNTRTCSQSITMQAVSNLTIQFPANITFSQCTPTQGTLPAATGTPVWSGNTCFTPTVNHTDQLVNDVSGEFYTILRQWRITDHCVYDPNTNTGVWLHTQQIRVPVCIRYAISGYVRNPVGAGIAGIEVTNGQGDTTYTDVFGRYEFTEQETGLNYTIRPDCHTDWLNGVSTYDLVLISRHLLQLEPFDTPDEILASDANQTGSLTTFDIVQLRKLILGVFDTIPDGRSWLFYPDNFQFADPMNPRAQPIPDTLAVGNLTADVTEVNFKAVKTGDLSGDAIPSIGFLYEGETLFWAAVRHITYWLKS
jgi:HYR domain